MTDLVRRFAAIDVGTVTTRLLVADVGPDSIIEVERSTDITHLGEGLTATGVLSDQAMARVREVIDRYVRRADLLEVEGVAAVATSASRDAVNSDDFLSMLDQTGVRPEIISGSREAHLTFSGAAFGASSGTVLVDDIGGGSTELIAGTISDTSATIVASRSVDVGSRRITELFLGQDVVSRSDLERAREFVVGALRPFFASLETRPQMVVSVAGTATSLAAIRLKLAHYDPEVVHGYRLAGSDISDILEYLAGMSLVEREAVAGLHPARAGVIVAGTLILEATLALAGCDSTQVSEHDILYGLLLDAYARA